MAFAHSIGGTRYVFDGPAHAAGARHALPLRRRAGRRRGGERGASASPRSARWPTCRCAHFLAEAVIPYEADEVTRLILDSHDAAAFAPVAHLTVGGFRDWLLARGRRRGAGRARARA